MSYINLINTFNSTNYIECTHNECKLFEKQNKLLKRCEICDGYLVIDHNYKYYLHDNTKYDYCDKLLFLYIYRVIFCILMLPFSLVNFFTITLCKLSQYTTNIINNKYFSQDDYFVYVELKALDDYKAIIIAKPDSAFDEKDKFIIDQFIMKGGKVLWCIDPLYTEADSLKRGRTLAVPYDLQIDDMLFKYGARINTNMILDLQCGDRKSTRLNSSHSDRSRMPSSA